MAKYEEHAYLLPENFTLASRPGTELHVVNVELHVVNVDGFKIRFLRKPIGIRGDL